MFWKRNRAAILADVTNQENIIMNSEKSTLLKASRSDPDLGISPIVVLAHAGSLSVDMSSGGADYYFASIATTGPF